jgi:hypothetical protein
MVRCHGGDMFGLFRHVWNVLCDVPIGSTYFGIKSELSNAETPKHRLSNAGRSDCHVTSWHFFGPNKAREAIQWRCGCAGNDQKRTKANEKQNICKNK